MDARLLSDKSPYTYLEPKTSVRMTPLKYAWAKAYLANLTAKKKLTNKQLNVIAGYSEKTCNNLQNDPQIAAYIQAVLQEGKDKAVHRIAREAPKSVEVITKLRDKAEDHIRLKAAVDLLDRAGVGVPDKTNQFVQIFNYEQFIINLRRERGLDGPAPIPAQFRREPESAVAI